MGVGVSWKGHGTNFPAQRDASQTYWVKHWIFTDLASFKILQQYSEISISFTTFTDEETKVQNDYVPSLPLYSSEDDLMGENQVKYLMAHKINTK